MLCCETKNQLPRTQPQARQRVHEQYIQEDQGPSTQGPSAKPPPPPDGGDAAAAPTYTCLPETTNTTSATESTTTTAATVATAAAAGAVPVHAFHVDMLEDTMAISRQDSPCSQILANSQAVLPRGTPHPSIDLDLH